MSKTVYHYAPGDGAYLGQSQADESPLEPGVVFVPAYATLDPVPAFDPVTQQALYAPAYWPTGIAKEQGGQWRVEALNNEQGGN
ncbi:hypothetical protein OL229_05175 [Neisseriaceae bacterium JH1-16]|nr:hypothetical protein [Neisseriaceae bacterium JH1-16]